MEVTTLCRHGGQVVEQLVDKSTAGLIYPMLMRTNYTECSAVMHANLIRQSLCIGLLHAIRTDPIFPDGIPCLACRLLVGETSMLLRQNSAQQRHQREPVIVVLHTSIFDRLPQTTHFSPTRRLQQDFMEIKFKPGESVEDFSLHITALANEQRVLGNEITDKEVVKKMLHLVLEKLEQVAISLEILLDLDKLSIEEAVGHL
jgi:hypothetical protein